VLHRGRQNPLTYAVLEPAAPHRARHRPHPQTVGNLVGILVADRSCATEATESSDTVARGGRLDARRLVGDALVNN